MKKTEVRKQAIVEKLADHLLAHGLKGASLRPLAAAAGMSDRMLLHYFADKEELLTTTLYQVTQRLLVMLDSARPHPMPFQELVALLSAMVKDASVRPYLRLWLELAASAYGGESYHRVVARRILDSYFDWVASALQVEREEERRPLASMALALVEGLVVLDAIGSDTLAASALEGVAIQGR